MEETTEDINYWKEIHNELGDTLKNLRGIALVTHNSIEFTHIIDFLNKIRPDRFLTVLYISLIRSYDYMRHALDQKSLDQKKICIIDCVSGFAFPAEDNIDECLYHKPPQNLTEMNEIIKFGIAKSNPEIVVIDSLSQFINFSRPTEYELYEFYELLRSLRKGDINLIQDTFILLYDNKMGAMGNLPKTSTDIILNIEVGTRKQQPHPIPLKYSIPTLS